MKPFIHFYSSHLCFCWLMSFFHSMQIIYMDHVDIPAGLPNEHAIDYSVPRIRFVCQKDFDWLDKVDKNKLTLVQPFYGKHTHVILLHPAYVFSFANGVLTPPVFCSLNLHVAIFAFPFRLWRPSYFCLPSCFVFLDPEFVQHPLCSTTCGTGSWC